MASLPDEIVRLLGAHGPVQLEVGGGEVPVGMHAHLAPLNRQLYTFVRPGSPVEQAMLDRGEVTFTAEDPQGQYLVRVRARAVLGRRVSGDPRRAELMYWLPEGARPTDLSVVYLHPEELEFVKGSGSARSRVAGPVPGGALPNGFSRWVRLTQHEVIGWYLVWPFVDWGGLLYLGVAPTTRVLVLALMLASQWLMLSGVALLQQRARYTRYREGLDAVPPLLLEGWARPRDLAWAGGGMIGAGLVLSLFLMAGSSPMLGLINLLGSGAPFFGVFFGVRHLFRHDDARDGDEGRAG